METLKLKAMVVGDQMVGKTNLLLRYAKRKSDLEDGENVNALAKKKKVFAEYEFQTTVDKRPALLTLVEAPSAAEYANARAERYRDVDIVLLCFSIDSPPSYVSIETKWHPEARRNAKNVPVVLVGTKHDLRKYGDELITKNEADMLCERLSGKLYVECSSVKGGPRDVFKRVAWFAAHNDGPGHFEKHSVRRDTEETANSGSGSVGSKGPSRDDACCIIS